MKPMRRLMILGGAALALAALSGCEKKAAPTEVEAHLRAAVSMNPDDTNRPSPMVVRYYELSALGAFESADFFALYNNDQSILGASLLAREEMELAPSESRVLRRVVSPGTRYVGFVAAYRDIANAQWRAVQPVTANALNTFKVTLGERTVELDGL